jgi:hypothetical protein
MKDKQETEDLTTDDELTREAGMTAGSVKKGRFTLRPMTPVSLSWLQRNRVFDDDYGDMLQKTAAYAFLHTEPKDEIRAVVHDRVAFLNAVDDWMEENLQHHTELSPVSDEMERAVEHYMAATTTAANPSPGKPGAAKN